MGVFKRLKDVLFDVEEDELPVITRKEEKIEKEEKIPKYKEENTIKEIKIPKEEVPERELIKSESTFNFPLDIDDEPVTRSSRSINFEEEIKKFEPRGYNKTFTEEHKLEKKNNAFKPTPIISPVYGILDQNYSKDDIIVKTDIGVRNPDLDEVRKKAYGINPKTPANKKADSVVDKEEEALKTLDEILMEEEKAIPVTEKKESPAAKILDDELPDEPYSDDEDHNIDNTIETDLFNLIDSMYEDRKESEEE